MKPKKRKKLCYNCDGEIDVDVIVCPFCAADLREEKPEQRYESYITHVDASRHGQQASVHGADLSIDESLEEDSLNLDDEEETTSKQKAILPTVLFTLGVQLCLLSVLMLLFSHKGVVLLKWDARYWFFYLAVSAPLIFFGYRSIQKIQ